MYLVPDWCPCDCPRDPHPCSCRRSPPPCPGPHDHRRQASALEGSKQYDFRRGSFGLEQQYLMFLQPCPVVCSEAISSHDSRRILTMGSSHSQRMYGAVVLPQLNTQYGCHGIS